MTLPEAAAAALRAALGPKAVAEESLQVDGLRVGWRLRPEDGPALGEALRLLSEHGLSALVRGGGTRSGLGNPPRAGDVLLSTAALADVEELDLDEGVARAGAGTPLVTLERALAGSGWELPLEGAGEASTLGGTLAAAVPGLRFGAPRAAVLGLDVALASGERTRCGGRVVKNVTGYDLAKLYLGSLGSLGVIEAAWLRLRPAPERLAWRYVALADDAGGFASALATAREPAVRAALLCGPGAGSRHAQLLLELAGDAAAVDAIDARLRERIGAAEAVRDDLVAGFAPALAGAGGARFRLALRPTRLASAAAALSAADARWVALPAHGLLWARFDGLDGLGAAAAGLAPALAAVRAAAEGGGSWLLESAPADLERGCDAFGDPGASLPLMRALKERFDPAGVLNPGRYAGGL